MTRFYLLFSFYLLPLVGLHAGVYENLEYGDSKEVVIKKLKNCERIIETVTSSVLGHSDLNGAYQVKKDLKGQKFTLSFGWTKKQKLKEITLRSGAISAAEYQSKLTESFNYAVELTTKLYGEPIMSNTMPPSSKIKESSVINSHLWHVDKGSLLIGVGKDSDEFYLSIRFLEKQIGSAKKKDQ